jgi:P-type Cu+ transporter
MDTLVSMGITTVCNRPCSSSIGTRTGRPAWTRSCGSGGGIYLEAAASVTTFQLAGRLRWTKAQRIAGQAMRNLAEVGARDARVLDDDGTGASSRGAADGTAVRGPAR